MLETIQEAIAVLQAETLTYPQPVQIWMKVMAVSFLASVIFVYSKTGARWILAAFLLNIVGLVAGKLLFPEASRTQIGTWVHVLFWPAMLLGVWYHSRPLTLSGDSVSPFVYAYRIWLGWACLLMCISLVLDFRTLFFLVLGST